MTANSPHTRGGTPSYAGIFSLACVMGIAFLLAFPATASEEGKVSKDKDAEADALPMPPSSPPPQLSPAEQYCSSVVDATAAAQIAQQTSNLQKAQKRLEDRVALLTAKTEELKSWVKRREDFTAHATESLVEIYSKMKPDAAAGQLTAMDELTAAAIMSKLPAKVSSLILAEMDSGKAARLTSIIAGAAEIAMKPEARANGQQQ